MLGSVGMGGRLVADQGGHSIDPGRQHRPCGDVWATVCTTVGTSFANGRRGDHMQATVRCGSIAIKCVKGEGLGRAVV